jgi:arginase
MRRVTLIQIPYDSGRLNIRMGTGPSGLMTRGLADKLRSQSEVQSVEIYLPDGFHTEASALIHLQHAAAAAARNAAERDALPIFLSGNCGTAALSATGILGGNQTGVVWFDAHADFNTPETSPSGFLDGMGLAILTGQCWGKLAARLHNFSAVPVNRIVQIGVRHVDPEEKLLLESLRITQIDPKHLDQLSAAVDRILQGAKTLYVHLDADVLDASEGQANPYACPGGLTRAQLNDCSRLLANTGAIRAISITSYDAGCDTDGRIADALIEAASILVG